ncbi:MAG: RICIN domain-containing protein [Lachnospiraceae bacterium]|nr:RICIN domain-containing protein [Lachnospiraceae bacterium]
MKRPLIRCLYLTIGAMLLMGACASKKELSEIDEKLPEETAKATGEQTEDEASEVTEESPEEETPEATEDLPEDENTEAADERTEDGTRESTGTAVTSSYFDTLIADTDRMIREAVEQFDLRDHTPLDEAVAYHVLWLGFTHVTYGKLDFRMTDDDREYLEAVALNFEKSVESITDHNLDITVDLHFIDETTPLTKADGDEWLYLAKETVQPVIDSYSAEGGIDTVLTTVQTAGKENRNRNRSKKGYDIHYVMLGLETADMSSPMGYSTFDLTEARKGTYPLQDPEIPSLYATAVAVHEWMHQLEYMGTLLGIEYPNTHAYMGPESYPGYRKYVADKNDYDYFEFYKLVLKGELPYKDGDTEVPVGMYPKMWKLVKRDVFDLGKFTIRDAEGQGYLGVSGEDERLTLTDDPGLWSIRYAGEGSFILSPEECPDKRIDLANAWDSEGNTVGLWYYTGYAEAQSWKLRDNKDGTYSIQTACESGRVVTVQKDQTATLCSPGAEGAQNWVIEQYQER